MTIRARLEEQPTDPNTKEGAKSAFTELSRRSLRLVTIDVASFGSSEKDEPKLVPLFAAIFLLS